MNDAQIQSNSNNFILIFRGRRSLFFLFFYLLLITITNRIVITALIRLRRTAGVYKNGFNLLVCGSAYILSSSLNLSLLEHHIPQKSKV